MTWDIKYKECCASLQEAKPNTGTEVKELGGGGLCQLTDRQLIEKITWYVMLSGYQYNQAILIWPQIKGALFHFQPVLFSLFPRWLEKRVLNKYNNPKKVEAILKNYRTALDKKGAHGSLKAWLESSANPMKELIETFVYIGPTNVKYLLGDMGLSNYSLREQGILTVFRRWGLFPRNRRDLAVQGFGYLCEMASETGESPLTAYHLLSAFSETICSDPPNCGHCRITSCTKR